MSVESLQRVMWRLRSSKPKTKKFTNKELKRAIMYECGTDPRTYYANRKALKDLQWIKTHGKSLILLTDKDLTEAI